MEDRLIRLVDKDLKLRIFAGVTTKVVEEARKIHNTAPVASAALGRTLTAGLMMGMMQKSTKEKTTIQIKGDGPLGGIVVASNQKGIVKGYVNNPDINLPPNSKGKLDVSGAIGKDGYLNVIKDIGMKEPYISFLPLVSGEIGEDFSYYFMKSEQIPSAVALGVLVDIDGSIIASGGFIIHLMPDAEEEIIKKIENNLENFTAITNYLAGGESMEKILSRVLGDMELKLLEEIVPKYLCDCSTERMESALISLGKSQLDDIISTEGKVEIQCHFCLKKYLFNQEQVDNILNE